MQISRLKTRLMTVTHDAQKNFHVRGTTVNYLPARVPPSPPTAIRTTVE